MRLDSIGLWWEDFDKVKAPKAEAIKRIAPERFWERPDYLPTLAEARAFIPDLYTDLELWQAHLNNERLLFDIEVYPNYCLFAFKGIVSGKVVYFELGENFHLDIPKLHWVLHNFCIVNFNGRKYDFPVTAVALAGHGSPALWNATCMIIMEQMQATDVYKKYKIKKPQGINQIDLIELTALAPGLKVCAGRLHAPRLQDLPFKPGTILTSDQILILRRYCINDLDNTGILYHATIKQIELREKTGVKYGLDLRSHSDAQMAEAIIASEIKRITGKKHLQRTVITPGTWYRYQTPRFISYSSPMMKYILNIVQNAVFVVGEDGAIVMPAELKELVINMGECSYKIGIGGLHSQEKSIAHKADNEYFIEDTDATSYYPKLMLNAGLTPENLGKDFLHVYGAIVTERVRAKQAGDSVVAECLKIVANGSFGKLGSMWSIMYAPNLMIQVTITGQLSILMLAERFELAGISVTSVNTDGIVVRCKRSMEAQFRAIVKQWERDTGFDTEGMRYTATYSRDINNYIAVYETPQKGEQFKTKGAYGKTSPKKNAIAEICVEAVKQFIAQGKAIRCTVRENKDVRKFTSMRYVAGGAVKGDPTEPGKAITSGIYLGKLIRWYHAIGEQGEIVYAKNGNKVPLTNGVKPLMDLPATFPADVDFAWYEAEAEKMLVAIGYSAAP